MKKQIIYLTIIVILLSFGCIKKKTDELATVGDITITTEDLEKRINEYSLGKADLTKNAIEAILNELVEQALILSRAKELGINVADEEITSFQNKISIIGGDIDKDRARTELLIQKAIDLDVGQHIDISQIETKPSETSNLKMVVFSEITAPSEETINSISEKLTAGADFKSILESNEDIEPGTKSSTTGPVSITSLPKEFQETLGNLTEGGTSSPIKSPYGYHILRLDSISEGSKETTSSIDNNLREEYLKAYQKWIEDLKKKIYININKEVLNRFYQEKYKKK
jgi:parvulin-like peptidyl-prolyl isomerase